MLKTSSLYTKIHNHYVTSILLFFLFFTSVSHSQNLSNSFSEQYRQLLLKSQDSAMSYCDQLIKDGENTKKALGFAGKAYVFTLKSEFEKADLLFKKSLSELALINQTDVATKSYILYLQSLRYIESHELETAIHLLLEAISSCSDKCGLSLEIKLQSALAKLYSLSNKHFKALEIGNLCLSKIKKSPNYATDDNLKTQYLKELVNLAFRSMNTYIQYADEKEYESYIDSTRRYTTLAKNYADKHQIQSYDTSLIILNSDINFYLKNYKTAKHYAEKILKILQKKKRKKRIAQCLFRIAICDYHLKNLEQSKATFLKQLENNTWLEFQLLDHEALCYFYLFKIYELKQEHKKALKYANLYASKIETYFKTRNMSDISINNIVAHENRKKEIASYIKSFESQKTQKHIFLLLLIFSLVILGGLTIYFFQVKRRTKKNIGLLHSRIAQLQEDITKQNTSKTSRSLTDINALKLIEKLKKLEKEQLFLQPNYTLAFAAKKLNTNSSYLSQTVNNHLNMTFAAYSNRLRIQSIVQRLDEQKSLRNYTIEALAKEAGYKSIGSFNTNFKKLLKVKPSEYLNELKRNEEE